MIIQNNVTTDHITTHSTWKFFAAVCIVLIAACFAAYWPVLSADFISVDDAEYVYKNPHVLAGFSWSGWRYAWTTWDCTNWHPLTWLSLEIDGSLWGKNAKGYHTTNLLLHSLNGVLLFAVMYQLSNCRFRSGWVAAFFVLHPLHVESVAWVAERKDVLSTLFLLLTISAYVRYSVQPSTRSYCLVLALFALGLLAKPMLVTLPILLLLLDGWPLDRIAWKPTLVNNSRFTRRSPRTIMIEKLPLIAMAFADGIMTIVAQIGPVKLMTDVTFDVRIANMFNAYLWYLEKTFVPINLIVLYPHPERNLPWTHVAIGVLVFCAISVIAIRQRLKAPHLLFGWAWFVISLLPVIGLIQVGMQAYADRYAYIPHIGLFTAIIWEVYRWMGSTKPGRMAGGLIGLIALIACGVLTHQQAGYWQNNDRLWTHALEVTPDNGFAHAHLSDVRFAEHDWERTIFHIENGLRSKRSGYTANAYNQWGICLIHVNRPAEAEQKFQLALQVDQNHEAALEEMAKMCKSQGRQAEAAQYLARHAKVFAKRMEHFPENAAAEFRLGFLQAQQGNIQQALVHFEKAVRLAPQSGEARANLAIVQLQAKRPKEAKANLLKAIELNPNLAVAHVTLAKVLEMESDIGGARKHLADALRINPDDIKAKQQLERLSTP